MQIDAPRRRRRLVSLTPLIDVVFILLVFFMLASTFMDWRGFNVTAPAEDTVADEDADDPWVLEVGADRWVLEGEIVERGSLRDRMRALRAEDAERVLQVVIDDDAPVQRLVDALDAAERAGLHDVSIQRGGRP